MASSGIASTSCSDSQSGSIGDLSFAFAICSTMALRLALQFLPASAATPCFARVSNAAPPANFKAGISARSVSRTSAFTAISAP
jgi:hypothetical protein